MIHECVQSFFLKHDSFFAINVQTISQQQLSNALCQHYSPQQKMLSIGLFIYLPVRLHLLGASMVTKGFSNTKKEERDRFVSFNEDAAEAM